MLSPDHDSGIGDLLMVYVSPAGPKNTTIPLGWPSRAPLVVRSVEGILRQPDYYPAQEQAEMSLSLVEGSSGREIEMTRTDPKGRFHFSDDVSRGLYFLHLSASVTSSDSDSDHSGTIPIEVNPDANETALDLDIGWTSCGLTHARKLMEPELIVGKVCGKVTDAEGGVISKAQIWLQAVRDDIEGSDETLTSATGDFSFPERNEGTYQLIVQSRGFRPYLRQIRLQPTTTPGCPQPAHIAMGVL